MAFNWNNAISKGLTGMGDALYKVTELNWKSELDEANFQRQKNLKLLEMGHASDLQAENHEFMLNMNEGKMALEREKFEANKDYNAGMLAQQERRTEIAERGQAAALDQTPIMEYDPRTGAQLTEGTKKQLIEDGITPLTDPTKAASVSVKLALDIKDEAEKHQTYINGKNAYEVYKNQDGTKSEEEFTFDYMMDQAGLAGGTTISPEIRMDSIKNAQKSLEVFMEQDPEGWTNYKEGMITPLKEELGRKPTPSELEIYAQRSFKNDNMARDLATFKTTASASEYSSKVLSMEQKEALSVIADDVEADGWPAVKEELLSSGKTEAEISNIKRALNIPEEVEAGSVLSEPSDSRMIPKWEKPDWLKKLDEELSTPEPESSKGLIEKGNYVL